jgi:hypothetical protein
MPKSLADNVGSFTRGSEPMKTEIVAAVIAAFVGFASSVVTLLLGLRSSMLERQKLQAERDRWNAELTQQARRGEAELARLHAETAKLIAEVDQIRYSRFEAQRNEIRDLVKLFDRAVFEAPLHSENPVDMFRAIRQTRIALQMAGASLVSDGTIAFHFDELRRLLFETEIEVQSRFPVVSEIAEEPEKGKGAGYESRERARAALGDKYFEPVGIMMRIRSQVEAHVSAIRIRLQEMSSRFDPVESANKQQLTPASTGRPASPSAR